MPQSTGFSLPSFMMLSEALMEVEPFTAPLMCTHIHNYFLILNIKLLAELRPSLKLKEVPVTIMGNTDSTSLEWNFLVPIDSDIYFENNGSAE